MPSRLCTGQGFLAWGAEVACLLWSRLSFPICPACVRRALRHESLCGQLYPERRLREGLAFAKDSSETPWTVGLTTKHVSRAAPPELCGIRPPPLMPWGGGLEQACVGSWELIVAFSDILQAVIKNQIL